MRNRYLETAIHAATTSGAILRAGLATTRTVHYKGEIDLVTDMDHQSEANILRILRKAHPGHAILAEESGRHTKRSSYLWIIDPLDGTTNYAHGLPLFSVSIGLQYRGSTLVGVIYDPIADELYTAIRGQGAWLNGRPLTVSTQARLRRALLVTGFAYRIASESVHQFAHFLQCAQSVRRLGSAALDLCYVAAGRFEAFWEFGLQPWDMAAGALIVREAGGQVSTFTGKRFSPHGKEILASNGAIHTAMVRELRNAHNQFREGDNG